VQLEQAGEAVRLAAVTAGSLAERTGLRKGDVIAQAAGKPVKRLQDLIALVRAQPEGTWLPLQVKRGEETHELVVRFPPAP
jgi:S1-C subfamily serine protease